MTKTVSFNKDVIGQYNMDPDIKDEWLAALRSGEYMQGHHRLKSGPNSYCCLGVLCVIFGRHQETFVDFVQRNDGSWTFPMAGTEGPESHSILPHREVYKWAGLEHENNRGLEAVIVKNDGDTTLTAVNHPPGLLPSLNDTYQYSFADIADYIERYL